MAGKKQGSNMPSLRRPRIAVYSRMSSKVPSLERVPLDGQKKIIARLCASQGWSMIADHDDSKVEE